MASGPSVLEGNRFAELNQLTSPLKKRQKKSINPSSVLSFDIPSHSNSKNPKFIIITPTDPKQPLTSVSVFLLKKAIDAISTSYEYITQLRDGNLLILVKSQQVANLFLSKKNLSNLCPVSISLHSHLNSSKGTVFAPCLNNLPEKEIVEEMSDQGVTEVYKFKKTEKRIIEGKEQNVEIPSGLVLFTFDLFRPPTSLDVGWYKLKVEEYFPNPMRCKKCQLLGHTMKRCTRTATCVTCNLPPHPSENCTRTFCANCADNHPASSKNCQRFIQAKEILKIKTLKKCSLAEAKQIYDKQNPTPSPALSYSSITANGTQPIPSSSSNLSPSTSSLAPTQTKSINTKQEKRDKSSLLNKSINKTEKPSEIPPTSSEYNSKHTTKPTSSIPSSLPTPSLPSRSKTLSNDNSRLSVTQSTSKNTDSLISNLNSHSNVNNASNIFSINSVETNTLSSNFNSHSNLSSQLNLPNPIKLPNNTSNQQLITNKTMHSTETASPMSIDHISQHYDKISENDDDDDGDI
ncbi:rho GTPase-activating protein gacK-like [Eupeodes corollae]|uniref:rho GTPase-activating protein gacK-like n=1 Tax=Eupeodes corollae TaxID=290404 RepID=UPI00248F4E09|nr:rho GTPase-activating protein gacK-like [Eupeodes corollae]